VAVVTVAPFDTVHSLLNQLLESETRAKLAGAFDRFALDYDPQCEFAVQLADVIVMLCTANHQNVQGTLRYGAGL
jgi:hypothetical protein